MLGFTFNKQLWIVPHLHGRHPPQPTIHEYTTSPKFLEQPCYVVIDVANHKHYRL
ncbi:MAG: hypothetical protein ACUVTM_07600 [Candidatus Bathyarchaeia archaeon]